MAQTQHHTLKLPAVLILPFPFVSTAQSAQQEGGAMMDHALVGMELVASVSFYKSRS